MNNYWEEINEIQSEINRLETSITSLEKMYQSVDLENTELLTAIEKDIISLKNSLNGRYSDLEQLRYEYKCMREVEESRIKSMSVDIYNSIHRDGFILGIKF